MKEPIPICSECGKRTNKGGWSVLPYDLERFSFICINCIKGVQND